MEIVGYTRYVDEGNAGRLLVHCWSQGRIPRRSFYTVLHPCGSLNMLGDLIASELGCYWSWLGGTILKRSELASILIGSLSFYLCMIIIKWLCKFDFKILKEALMLLKGLCPFLLKVICMKQTILSFYSATTHKWSQPTLLLSTSVQQELR